MIVSRERSWTSVYIMCALTEMNINAHNARTEQNDETVFNILPNAERCREPMHRKGHFE